MSRDEQELQTVVDRRIAEVAATISADDLGRLMGARLQSAIPELTSTTDEDFLAGLVRSCTSNVVEILNNLQSGAPAEASTPPPDAIAWAHELVHRGLPLASLLRSYRLGHGLFQQTFERAASAIDLDPDIRWRVLSGAAQRTFAYIDIVCTQLVEDYEAERGQWLRGAAAVQAELVQAIVAGAPLDPDTVATTLRYDVTATQLAFILWRDLGGAVPHQSVPLASVAKQLAAELGGTHSLILPVGDHAAWVWTTGPQLSDRLPARSAALGDRAGAAIGGIHRGLEGMCRSHREARAARRVGDIFGYRPGTLLRFPAVALTSLISADPEQAAELAVTELAGLGADSDSARRLRATIQVYLDERLSPSRTARRLGIHQNTVTYRVKRAEELIGHPLDDRRLELELALRLFDGLDGLRAQTTE
ncbi:helix-turn-helix domain-containing protein [Paraconexibacter sp. AEG42_29]|uniref:PucR family transcriptional regulator n=1 Tax=Paraconexibacter sp. AEG42_29 TaxID=2997339 RepID=UPI00339D5977